MGKTFMTFDGFDASPRTRTIPCQRVVNSEWNETKVTLFNHERESTALYGMCPSTMIKGAALLTAPSTPTLLQGPYLIPNY